MRWLRFSCHWEWDISRGGGGSYPPVNTSYSYTTDCSENCQFYVKSPAFLSNICDLLQKVYNVSREIKKHPNIPYSSEMRHRIIWQFRPLWWVVLQLINNITCFAVPNSLLTMRGVSTVKSSAARWSEGQRITVRSIRRYWQPNISTHSYSENVGEVFNCFPLRNDDFKILNLSSLVIYFKTTRNT